MKLNENIQLICNSLTSMGLEDASDTLIAELGTQKSETTVAVIALALKRVATERHEALAERLVKRSKLGQPCYLSDLLRYEERMLDIDLIDELGELYFVSEQRNVAIWGAPGTGKTWLAKAIATNACKSGIRTRWITFPTLYRELKRLKAKDLKSLESRFQYYAKFQLLCIDEFPNADIDDNYIVQEFFNIRAERKASTLVCSQSNPDLWEHLFPIRSLGESIKGRILQNASRLEMKGPDLRLDRPE